MNKDQLIHEIGARLVADIGATKKDWAHLVLAGKIERNNRQITGFAYTQDGRHEPFAPTDFDILKLLLELRNAMATADQKPPWQATLIRIDRNTGEIKFDFEYDKPDRWLITPNNVSERANELNPVRK
jgi:hypothetical protein